MSMCATRVSFAGKDDVSWRLSVLWTHFSKAAYKLDPQECLGFNVSRCKTEFENPVAQYEMHRRGRSHVREKEEPALSKTPFFLCILKFCSEEM